MNNGDYKHWMQIKLPLHNHDAYVDDVLRLSKSCFPWKQFSWKSNPPKNSALIGKGNDSTVHNKTNFSTALLSLGLLRHKSILSLWSVSITTLKDTVPIKVICKLKCRMECPENSWISLSRSVVAIERSKVSSGQRRLGFWAGGHQTRALKCDWIKSWFCHICQCAALGRMSGRAWKQALFHYYKHSVLVWLQPAFACGKLNRLILYIRKPPHKNFTTIIMFQTHWNETEFERLLDKNTLITSSSAWTFLLKKFYTKNLLGSC